MRQSAATEAILKKLVEAEVDGQTIADHAAGFTDAIQRLREVSSSVPYRRSQGGAMGASAPSLPPDGEARIATSFAQMNVISC